MCLCLTEFLLISKKSLDFQKIELNSILSGTLWIGQSAGIQGTHRWLWPSLSLKDFIVFQSGNIYGGWPVAEAQRGNEENSIHITLIKGRCVIHGTGRIKSQKKYYSFQHLLYFLNSSLPRVELNEMSFDIHGLRTEPFSFVCLFVCFFQWWEVCRNKKET